MQKILITEKGLNLQQDIKLEVSQDKLNVEKEKKQKLSKHYNQTNNSRVQTLEAINEENGKTVLKRSGAIDFFQTSNKDINLNLKTEQEVKSQLLPNSHLLKANSAFIKKKLSTATHQILNPPILSPLQTKNDRNINNLFTTIGPKWGTSFTGNISQLHQSNSVSNFRQGGAYNISNMNSFYNNSLFASNIFQNPSKLQVLQEMVHQSKQNQFIHHESKFQRLTDNWINLQNQRVKQKFQMEKQIQKSPILQALNTRPETLLEIKQKNQDALDVIGQENNIYERTKMVYYQLHQKNIQKQWNKTYFPTSIKEKKEKGINFSYHPYTSLIKKEKTEDLQLRIAKVWKKQI